jgi:hypothetical protein
MTEEVERLLFELAGYLSLVTRGITPPQNEAAELLEKIGRVLGNDMGRRP